MEEGLYFQKLFTSRNAGNANVYVGEAGRMFYDQTDGLLRLSDGETPGGIIVTSPGGGGTANLVDYDCGSASTPSTAYVLRIDMGAAG